MFEILVAACFRYILKPRPNAAWNYLGLRFSPTQTYSPHPIFMGVLSINTKRIAASVFHLRKEDSLVNKKFYTVIIQTNWSNLYNNWSRLLFFILYCITNSLWRDSRLENTINIISNLGYPLLLLMTQNNSKWLK